jgi:hypothetical protein
MDFNAFRDRFYEYRDLAVREGEESKDSQLTPHRLSEFYAMLDPKQREMADRVIAQWAASPDESVRFDARHLIDEFKIRSAAAALRHYLLELATSSHPGAPYERDRILQLLAALEDQGNSGAPRVP